MCAKWAEPSSRTVRIPSIQTMLLIVLLVGSVTAIVWVSVAVQLTTPPPAAPVASSSGEGPAAWISAVGQVVGAVGTAGALLLGVWVYLRQEEDQRRAQAAAVSVGNTRTLSYNLSPTAIRPVMYYLRNDSPLPIYKVVVYVPNGEEREQDFKEVLPPGESASFMMPSENYASTGKFIDTAGRCWKRTSSGTLTQIKDVDGPWEMD